jgi:hypothetical protein
MDEWRDKLVMLPEHMQGAMERWIEHGMTPGGFLTAVLVNSLFDAYGHADATNRTAIPDYVTYLYNYAPSGCWGSPEKFRAWFDCQGLQNEQRVKYDIETGEEV